MAQLVAITACPRGIARSMMAADALQRAARSLGHAIAVETQDASGAQHKLTAEAIAAADVVVIAADMELDMARFVGKPIYITGTRQAIHAGGEVIQVALARRTSAASSAGIVTNGETTSVSQARRSSAQLGRVLGPYQHLMSGVSYMQPIVVAGGLAIVLAFAVGGIYPGDQPDTISAALDQIGRAAFSLFVAVLSAFIAASIANRPGIAPGLVGGLLAQQLGTGYLGAVASGFIAGYFTRFLAHTIKLPARLAGLKPVLILPFLTTLVVGLLMIYAVGPLVQALLTTTSGWLNKMHGASAVLLGILLGAMMAFDMGGPVNKAAYTFALGLLAGDVTTPMAAVMAGGMTPSLGMACAAFFFGDHFDHEERAAAGPALALGFAYVTEGAIPFAAKDPLRVIPSLMLGSAVAGGLSMLFGVQSRVPHGGLFAALLPGIVSGLPFYLIAILAGTLATAGTVVVLKRRRPREEHLG